MKPSKQKIFSSQPIKPGSATKLQIISSLASLKSEQLKTQSSEFSLSSISTSLSIKQSTAPFKLLNFSSSLKHKEKVLKIRQRSPKKTPVSAHRHGYSNLCGKSEGIERTKGSISECRDDEVCNNTTDTVKYRGDSIDEYFGIFPNKYWCDGCKNDVVSKVKMNLPTLSV